MRKKSDHMLTRRRALQGISALAAGVVLPEETARIQKTLLIGNSYTIRNDLANMLKQIAAQNPDRVLSLYTDIAAKDGATLRETWDAGAALQKLHSLDWDYVVLQDHSLSDMTDNGIARTKASIAQWSKEIRGIGAVPILYETWPREPNSKFYTDPELHLGSPKIMHRKIAEVAGQIAEANRLTIAPVGDLWYQLCCQGAAPLSLYNADHTHPNLLGTYLAALTIYATLTGLSPEHVTYAPEGISSDDAQRVRLLVAHSLPRGTQRLRSLAPLLQNQPG